MQLSEKGIILHLDNIEHQSKLYEVYKAPEAQKSIDNSKSVLLNAFRELKED